MKKSASIFLVISFVIFRCDAQPNPGFENWTTQYSYETPDNWQTLNFLSITFPANPISALKATGVDKHSGNYALELKTIFINNNPFPGSITDTMGDVFTGKINISPPSLKYGYAYSGRPAKMEFYAKYQPVATDTAGGAIYLFKWNGIKRDTIAYGDLKIPPASAYTSFQINIDYTSTEVPDTALIAFSSSYKKSRARVGSTLFLDDLAFTGWVGIEENKLYADKVKVFPNPAKGEINISAQIPEADNVQIIEASGKLSGTFKIQDYNAKVNTNLYSEGTYFYNIRDKNERPLFKGKFNIIK